MNFPPSMQVLERGWLSSNNIVFVGSDHTAIVDTGYCTHALQTLQLVRHVLRGRALDAIYNTHLHSDHCGGNHLLQTHFPGLRTFVPEAELSRVRRWDRAQLSFDATGQRCDPFRADAPLCPGDTLRLGDLDWAVLSAPGHHPYTCLLFCAQHGILISADALWERGFGVIFPALDGGTGFDEARATLELIASLDVRIVIPGHGKPFTEVDKALDTAFSRLDYLQADPIRNAQNGVKVLLKFLLMERQRIRLADLPVLLQEIPLAWAANQRYLHYGAVHLSHWVTMQLQRAGAAFIENDYLVNLEAARA